MARFLPMTLSGDNLGQRHRYLNSQVNQAAEDLLSFQDVEDIPEQTAVDRIFKIDLAVKLKNIDYILKNLKDDDMLYVSRALKCKWLVERRDIINPQYLEDVLFPDMVMPAISKMKHWLYINVRDPVMCQDFYQYYKKTKFYFAVKFLVYCDDKFVLNEFPNIMTKITPHLLKVFGEKWPDLIGIYFDSLAMDNELVQRYLTEERKFYYHTKCVMKLKPNMFLDVIEKYHNLNFSKRFSPSVTEYILRFHKNRFLAKSELYVAYILHVPTVARCLSVEECQDVVIKLARANYLTRWFSYKNVEPLVKRVSPDKRAAFKKQVFVQKDVGERVTKWPYEPPASPEVKDILETARAFQDRTFSPISIDGCDFRAMLKKRKYAKWGEIRSTKNSELQKLFDQYRFMGFESTLHELKKRVFATATADRRRDMLLVLVSKSGRRADAVRELLKLALELRNEPVHERAAVVRSLVKRASVWRLPQDVWEIMLEYARGLGLDGSKPEADCHEGLHAVVMRQLIATGDCDPAVRTVFLDNFTTFGQYKLEKNERDKISAGLQHILVTVANDVAPWEGACRLGQLLNVYEKYHISLKSSPAVSAIKALAERDASAAITLLKRLYKARVGRRELLRQNLAFKDDDAALLNALRHDPNAINHEWFVKLLSYHRTKFYQFLLKLGIYFNEVGGIAEQIRNLLREKITQEPGAGLAGQLGRPLAMLAGSDIITLWCEQEDAGDEYHKLVAALRANMHRARPAPNALALGWRKVGMKAVARYVMRCRPGQVLHLAHVLLEERVKRTVRLALTLAQRTNSAVDIFSIAVTIHPRATLRAALLYFRRFGDAADLRIWDIVKPVLSGIDLSSSKGLRYLLKKVEWIPKAIKIDYTVLLYLVLDKCPDRYKNNSLIKDLFKCLPEISEELLEKLLSRMLETIGEEQPESHPAFVIRYLMLSKTHEEASIRFEKILGPYLAKIEAFRFEIIIEDQDCFGTNLIRQDFFFDNVEQIMACLQYNFAIFDNKYECCLLIIEKVQNWIENFMSKEKYFKKYVKIGAIILYYQAVRDSIKQNPEVFGDPVKKISDGVGIVGFTFGRYIAKEVVELKSEYFDSIVHIYSEALIEYLAEQITFGDQRVTFVAAVIKGILSDTVDGDSRVACHILHSWLIIRIDEEIKDLLVKRNDKQMQFFLHNW